MRAQNNLSGTKKVRVRKKVNRFLDDWCSEEDEDEGNQNTKYSQIELSRSASKDDILLITSTKWLYLRDGQLQRWADTPAVR
jgi:hypothetical protein